MITIYRLFGSRHLNCACVLCASERHKPPKSALIYGFGRFILHLSIDIGCLRVPSCAGPVFELRALWLSYSDMPLLEESLHLRQTCV